MEFVFPPYYDDSEFKMIAINLNTSRMGENNYNINTGKLVRRSPKGIGQPQRNSTIWKPLFKSIDTKYNVAEKVIPTGTILYRGSLDSNPSNVRPDSKLVYFG